VFRWAAELDPRSPHYAWYGNVAMILSGIPVPPGLSLFARESQRELARINSLDDN
jgi:hypothetical protein